MGNGYGDNTVKQFAREEILRAIQREISKYDNKPDKEVAQSIYKIVAEMRFS